MISNVRNIERYEKDTTTVTRRTETIRYEGMYTGMCNRKTRRGKKRYLGYHNH